MNPPKYPRKFKRQEIIEFSGGKEPSAKSYNLKCVTIPTISVRTLSTIDSKFAFYVWRNHAEVID